MAKISDDLREFADAEVLNAIKISDLKHMAKRIDAEMVELPKDKDGEPIHVGDKVYLDDGRMACVTEIDINDGCEVVDCWDVSKHVAYHPSGISHTRPDSLERIADELEELSESNRINGSGEVFYRAGDLAARIRRLADKEG